MIRAGDVQNQPVWAFQSDPGAIAPRPTGQASQEPVIGLRIGQIGNNIRRARAGIGQAHAPLQPLCLGRLIQAPEPLRVVLGQSKRKWPLDRPGTQGAVTCQPRKPQRCDAPAHPSEASICLMFLICS